MTVSPAPIAAPSRATKFSAYSAGLGDILQHREHAARRIAPPRSVSGLNVSARASPGRPATPAPVSAATRPEPRLGPPAFPGPRPGTLRRAARATEPTKGAPPWGRARSPHTPRMTAPSFCMPDQPDEDRGQHREDVGLKERDEDLEHHDRRPPSRRAPRSETARGPTPGPEDDQPQERQNHEVPPRSCSRTDGSPARTASSAFRGARPAS